MTGRDFLYLCLPCIRRHELIAMYDICSPDHPCECSRCDCKATKREGGR